MNATASPNSLNDIVPIEGAEFLMKNGVELSGVGLSVSRDLTLKQYTAIGQYLTSLDGRVQTALAWLWGDWWAFGEFERGDRTAIVTADDWTGPALKTLETYATVCRRFSETPTRVGVLSFKHHRAVVELTVEQRDRLLKKAVAEEWSAAELKGKADAIRGKGAGKKKDDPAPKTTYSKDSAPPEPDGTTIEAEREPDGATAADVDDDEDFADLPATAGPAKDRDDERDRADLEKALRAWSQFNNVLAQCPGAAVALAADESKRRRFMRDSANALPFVHSGEGRE